MMSLVPLVDLTAFQAVLWALMFWLTVDAFRSRR